ncbi:MAG: alginate export family protein [Fimbriimonadaceae bacterium]|nr:alginate export family protein [Fimbriimonadaceae bacterium]QOJ10763.1 MAG: alginate export family protein [Chthonomonadaceae bacterium]
MIIIVPPIPGINAPSPALLDDPKFKPILEIRQRLERREDKDFDESVSDDRRDWLSRVRFGFDYTEGDSVMRVLWQRRDNRFKVGSGPETDTDNDDLFEGYLKRTTDASTFQIGRFRLSKGDQRLLGEFDWGNGGRSWDGVRFQTQGWDLFAGKIAVDPTKNWRRYLGGVAKTWSLGETMLVYKNDRMPTPQTSIYTLDHRWSTAMGRFGVTAEGAFQWGRSGAKDVEAWFAHAQLNSWINDRVRFRAEGNIASGGSLTGSKDRTFDQLFPTNHYKYGTLDMQGLQNMTHGQVGLDFQFSDRFSVSVDAHTFELFDAKDGWYGAGGAFNTYAGGSFFDPTGASGSRVGSEYDVIARFTISNNMTLEAGGGMFKPGPFVKSFGVSDEQFWGYVMARFRM